MAKGTDLYLAAHPEIAAQVRLLGAERVAVVAPAVKPDFRPAPKGQGAPKPLQMIRAWLDGAYREMPVFRRVDCLAGQSFPGPAVVVQDDCTTVVPTNCHVTVDGIGNLRIAVEIREE